MMYGQAAYDASATPISMSVRGGIDSPETGITYGESSTPTTGTAGQFAGMGPLLEQSDADAFLLVDGLVRRQEILAKNRLAQDTHWTYAKLGYPWSTLTKEPGRDIYVQSLPYGSQGISIQPIPNKMWDVVNKTTQQLLQDFPLVEAQPNTDDEDAQAACDMADRFLAENASEQGTNDAQLFHDRVERSLTCATTYIETWIDPAGGGSVPLQIKAHPLAKDVNNPLFGPNGEPTTDYVQRYVTPPGPNGEPPQFTNDASQADMQWQPRVRSSKWQREHVRTFPETAAVDKASQVVILGYCTLGEARLRWKSIANMKPDEISKLCDWTPVRYLALLPPFQRGRWKISDGKETNKAGSSDERIMFYYHAFAKGSPIYRKGADVVMTGAMGGFVIERKLLCVDVSVPAKDGAPAQSETRYLEIPVTQITPRGDADEQDPTGRAYVEMIGGAVEHQSVMAMSAADIIDKQLNPDRYIPSTSPVTGEMVENSRKTGDYIDILTAADKPIIGVQPEFSPAYFSFYEKADEAINSIAATERAASGQDNSAERSGRAIQIATANNSVNLSGMNAAVNNAYARYCRITIEQVMGSYTESQQIEYVGDDGAYQQDDFKGIDFSRIGRITIKAGTGTLKNPDSKVQFLGNLVAANMMDKDEAADAAHPLFSRSLGLPPDPQTQRIERQVTSWLKGPPTPTWVQEYQAYQQASQVAQQQTQAAMAQWQQQAAQAQQTGMQPPPQPQPAQPMNPQTNQPLAAPWTPFDIAPMDDEPVIAALRQRRLRRLRATSECTRQPKEWIAMVDAAYSQSRNAVAAVAPLPALPHGVSVVAKTDASSVGAAEYAAAHPQAPQPPHP